MTRLLWIRIGISLLALAGIVGLYQFAAPQIQPLPVYMPLPGVTLTDQNGEAFDLAQTRGRVVLLSLIYTHCPDVCPVTTAKMKQVQDLIRGAGLNDQVQLITFTVDPERDTPDVLQKYQHLYHGSPDNWTFLSGASDKIDILIKGLDLYVERVYYVDNTPVPVSSLSDPLSVAYVVNHTDLMFLVDRQGNVRAMPPGSRSDVNETFKLIQKLVREQSGG